MESFDSRPDRDDSCIRRSDDSAARPLADFDIGKRCARTLTAARAGDDFMKQHATTWLLLVALAGLTAGGQCAVDVMIPGTQPGGMIDEDDADTNGTSDTVPPVQKVSFADDVQLIFDAYCIRCHVFGGFANQSGIPLRLTTGISYDLLVNQSSAQNPNWKLVTPGNPETSLLYLKISSDSPPVGKRMPWDQGPAPNAEQTESIRLWIAQGAENN